MSEARPTYYGGQAVIEGVMMRGADRWAVAVRRPDDVIHVEQHPTSDFPERHPAFKRPLLRGTFALVDSLRVGTRALSISARESVGEEETLSDRELGGSLVIALLFFVAIFVVLPNVGLVVLGRSLGDGLAYHLVEGGVRVAIFLAYLGGISLMADIRRVFAYHGAEHMTIAAWEHGERLEPRAVARYSTLHVRCGTNFLLMVMLVAIVLYAVAGALVPAPDGGWLVRTGYHVALRVVLLPVVAGVAYEGLRLGAGHDNLVVRALMRPGLWLQMITTKPPEPGMIEVAIRAFQAVVPAAELGGRVSEQLPSAVAGAGLEAGADAGPADVTGEPVPRPAGATGGETAPRDGSGAQPPS